jgi:hypothetical protein
VCEAELVSIQQEWAGWGPAMRFELELQSTQIRLSLHQIQCPEADIQRSDDAEKAGLARNQKKSFSLLRD